MKTKYLPKGLMASVAIQCTHPDGSTGSFLYTAENHRDPENVISPCFPSSYELHHWAIRNSWECIRDRYRFTGEPTKGQIIETHMATNYPNVI